MKFNINNTEDIKQATLRLDASSRGGGIEISLSHFGYPGAKMTAYQNYLGGGMLGSIQNDCTLSDWKDHEDLVDIANGLSKYFHNLTNPDTEWEGMSFEKRQSMPKSAY